MAVVPSPDPAGFFIALHEGLFAGQALPGPLAGEGGPAPGVVPLADPGQGATSSFPVQGCAVARQRAKVEPGTLAAFSAAFGQRQQPADINRAAVERAMGALPPPPGLIPAIAALSALDGYPAGGEDPSCCRRNAAVPGEPRFNVTSMLSRFP